MCNFHVVGATQLTCQVRLLCQLPYSSNHPRYYLDPKMHHLALPSQPDFGNTLENPKENVATFVYT